MPSSLRAKKVSAEFNLSSLDFFYSFSYSNLISSDIQLLFFCVREKAVWISRLSGDESEESSGGARAWRRGKERKKAMKYPWSGFCCNCPRNFVVANIECIDKI